MALPVDVGISTNPENQWDIYRPKVTKLFFWRQYLYQLFRGRAKQAKFEAVDSNKLVIGSELAPPLNAGARVEGDDMPLADKPEILNFRVPIADEMGTLRFTDRQKRRIRQSRNAFIDIPGRQYDWASRAMYQDINRQVVGFGDGALATVSAGATTSSGRGIPIAGQPGVRPISLKRKQRITVRRSGTEVTNAADDDGRIIQNVRYDFSAKQWYVDLYHEAGVTSEVTVQANDKLYINGAYGSEGLGILAFLYQSTPGAGAIDPYKNPVTLASLDREDYPELAAIHWQPTENLYPELDHEGKFSVRKFRLLLEIMLANAPDGNGGQNIQAGDLVYIGHPSLKRWVLNAYDGLRNFRPGEPVRTAWPGAVMIEDVEFLPTYDFPYGSGVVLYMPTWTWFQEAELEYVDGGGTAPRVTRVGRKAEYESYLWYAWQLWCDIPSANAYTWGFNTEGERFGVQAA